MKLFSLGYVPCSEMSQPRKGLELARLKFHGISRQPSPALAIGRQLSFSRQKLRHYFLPAKKTSLREGQSGVLRSSFPPLLSSFFFPLRLKAPGDLMLESTKVTKGHGVTGYLIKIIACGFARGNEPRGWQFGEVCPD